MTIFSRLRRLSVAAAFGAAMATVTGGMAGAVPVDPTSYRTSITFDTITSTNQQVDLIQIDWASIITSGVINASDLTDLTFRLFGDDVLLYEDVAIVDGAAQPIGGVARSIDGMLFVFDFDLYDANPTSGLSKFDNDLDAVQEGASSGATWNIYGNGADVISVGAPPRVVGYSYSWGKEVDDFYTASVTIAANTVEVSPIPLPASAPLMLAALGGLGLLARRRKAA